MRNCQCGFRRTDQTFVAKKSVVCSECGNPVTPDVALHTGHDFIKAVAMPRSAPPPRALAVASQRGRPWQTDWFALRPWR